MLFKKIIIPFLLANSCHAAAAGPAEELKLFDILSKFEGNKKTPYHEKGDGYSWVVGVGHNLTAHKQFVKSSYSDQEIRDFFHEDYLEALSAARRLVYDFDGLPDSAQIVVIQLIWSVGPAGFAKFKNFRIALKYRSWAAARAELLDSKWAKQVQKDRVEWATNLLKKLDD